MRRVTVEVEGRAIDLDVPANVFGDGAHPTTATCLALVVDLVGPGMAVLDLGCGAGYFLDLMDARVFTNVRGITLSQEDLGLCAAKGHRDLVRGDMNFLADAAESVDLLFCRHSLEHSPFPYITLIEYNRVLKPNGVLYVEVPAPDCELAHEQNRNHFSILGRAMWLSLLERTGFDVAWHDYEFPVNFADDRGTVHERYYIFVCRRRRPMDIK